LPTHPAAHLPAAAGPGGAGRPVRRECGRVGPAHRAAQRVPLLRVSSGQWRVSPGSQLAALQAGGGGAAGGAGALRAPAPAESGAGATRAARSARRCAAGHAPRRRAVRVRRAVPDDDAAFAGLQRQPDQRRAGRLLRHPHVQPAHATSRRVISPLSAPQQPGFQAEVHVCLTDTLHLRRWWLGMAAASPRGAQPLLRRR